MTAGARPRLTPETLERSGGRARPGLGARPEVGIVHLGIGAFHRAHQAVYTAEAVERAGGDWGILGVAQRRPAAVEALAPQDGLFSVVERGPEEDGVAVYSTVRDVLLAPQDPERLAEAIASPGVHVVTLTVTERGYPRDRATGGLRLDDLEVASDLAGEAPRTVVGQLARGLALRAGREEAGPLTIVSCDNLPRNGEVLARLVRDFCARLPARGGGPVLEWMRAPRAPSRARWSTASCPATTADDREEVARRLGLEDRAAVVAEPFRQWVIEDAFAGPRPAWDRAGALLVEDSGPHEAVKLRLLNGTHSLLAYVGGLAGARTVAGAWGDPAVAAAAERLGSEDLEPTLPEAPGIDIADYRAELGRRWINPRIAHRLEQIGADGSQKLPARFAEPARERLDAGAPPRWIALALAAWARHLQVPDGLAVNDPGAEPIQRALARASDHDAEAAAVLAAMGSELAAPGPLRDLVADWLARIDADGIAGALREAVRA